MDTDQIIAVSGLRKRFGTNEVLKGMLADDEGADCD